MDLLALSSVSWLICFRVNNEAFIGDIRAKLKLVVGSFTTKESPTTILVDDLLKCIYLNGLDQVYFERPINRLVEDLPDANS